MSRLASDLSTVDGVLHGGWNYVTKSAAYNANDGDFIRASGRFPVTLLNPAANDKAIVRVFNEGTGVIQPLTAAGTIVGDSRLLAPQALGTYVCDGDNNRWIAQVKERFRRPPLRSAAQGQYYTYDSATFPSEWTESVAATPNEIKDGAWVMTFAGLPPPSYYQQLASPINPTGDTVVYMGPFSWSGTIPSSGTAVMAFLLRPDAAGPDLTRHIGAFIIYSGGQWYAQTSVVAPPFASTDINMDEYTFQSPIFIAIVIRQNGTHSVAYGQTNNVDAMRHIEFPTALLPAAFGTPWMEIKSDADGPMLINIGGIDRHDA